MGGSQYQAKLLIEQLYEAYGANVAYFTARANVDSHFDDHQVICVGRSDSLRRFGHFWDYFRLQKALRAFAPDVIYQRVSCSYTGIAARYASRSGIPLVWHIVSENDCRKAPAISQMLSRPHALIEKRLAQRGIEQADVIIAQTKDQVRMLHENFGRKADRVIRNFHPVPPAVDKRVGVFTVIWIANFKPLKRPELFLEIASRLQDLPGVEFLMVGQPYSTPLLQGRFDQMMRRQTDVKCLGAMPQGDVNRLLDRSHLLVNTSEWEGFSNAFIQAWMRSVPVLTLGGNPDRLLSDGYLGQCYDSTAEIADCIRRLAANPDMLEDMGKKSRQYAIRHFSMKNAAELVGLIVETAADRCNNRPTIQQEI
jgi:glycosyltransferase involved in cell wall biosynthesis